MVTLYLAVCESFFRCVGELKSDLTFACFCSAVHRHGVHDTRKNDSDPTHVHPGDAEDGGDRNGGRQGHDLRHAGVPTAAIRRSPIPMGAVRPRPIELLDR